MAKTKPKTKDKDVPRSAEPEKVHGRDSITGRKLFLPPGTPGFTPDK